MAAPLTDRNPATPLAAAARARGSLHRVWEGAGAPALLLAELRDVEFWIAPGIDGVIFLDGDEAVEESLRFVKPVNARGRALGRRVRRPRAQEVLGEFEDILLPVDPGWMNYFHWLAIHAPSLRAADAWLEPSIPAALPRHADHLDLPRPISFAASVMKESLASLRRPLRALPPGAYRARRLWRFLVEAPQQAEGLRCEPWDRALRGLAAELRSAGGAGESAGRLFASRRGARRRPLAAEEDPRFRAALQRLGFEVPSLAGSSLSEQAARFRGARLVAGAHGAALTNLLFCEPGASVLEFNARVPGEEDPRPHFRRIAEARGLDYRECVVEPGEDPMQLAEELARWAGERA